MRGAVHTGGRRQRYCSRYCGIRHPRPGVVPSRISGASSGRPYEQLMREIAETSYVAVGRKYGVSDNAIRKWVRAAGAPLPPGKRPVPPVRRALDDDGVRDALRLARG